MSITGPPLKALRLASVLHATSQPAMNAPVVWRNLAAHTRPSSATSYSFQVASSIRFRNMSTTTATVPSRQQQQARFSQGSDEASMSSRLETLLGQGRWTLTMDGQAVERSFMFKNFAKTWDFMTAVSLQCKTHNHHPEWSNMYNTTFIRWTTHDPKGLSVKDLKLAMICNALANDFGEVEAPPAAQEEASSCGIRGLADKAISASGDCCSPKPKN